MLVEFRVRNFRSFRDEQVLSLVAGRDTTLSENCIVKGQFKLLKAVAVYGANASGKSNLVKALDKMRDLVLLESPGYKPAAELGITPFLLDNCSCQEPSMFEVTFYHEGVRYQYGFEASSKRVDEEWLIAYPKGTAQKWFERVFNAQKSRYEWKYSTFLKGEKAKLAEKTRQNALFLSVAAQWNHGQLGTVYEWFRKKLQAVGSAHNLRPVTAEMLLAAEETDETRSFFDVATNLLREADLGIAGVSVKKKKVDVDSIPFIDEMPDELRSRVLEGLEGLLNVEMLHSARDGGEDIRMPLEEESDGTQEFFKLIGPWMQACVLGITIFIDELEASLHPLLARALVEMIQNPKISKSGAQLVFTSHDTTLQDQKLLRRDQIWFAEKGRDGATRLCPLSDYRPRKDEAIQKGYLSGRYGAVPMLERFSLE